jgi:hypothetical protein
MTITTPHTTTDVPARVGRILKTLAAAKVEGLSLDTALLAALIVDFHDVASAEAVDLAQHEAFDERVRQAGTARDLLVALAQADAMAAEQAEVAL